MHRCVLPLLAVTAVLSGCKKEGCLTGNDPTCVVPSPCPELTYTCDDGFVSLQTIASGDATPGGMAALAAPGDIWLQNDKVSVVVEALNHPHYLGPTGGGIVDFTTIGKDNDSLRGLFHGTGLLPTEAFHYTSIETIEQDGLVAVQVKGALDGFPDIFVATRYELRPCEPGVRVRTEVVNRTPDPQTWFVTDAWYWGGRELLPFTPGAGLDHPGFGLSTVSDAFREIPFMVAGAHTDPAATYATLSCDTDEGEDTLHGFQSTEVTAVGREQRIVMPRDYEVFERFHIASDGPDIGAAADLAYEARRKLFGESTVELSGTIDGRTDNPIGAAITVSNKQGALTHTVPDADGSWSVQVPAGGNVTLKVESFGREVTTETVSLSGDTDAGSIAIPSVGKLTLDARVDGVPDYVLAFVLPADLETEEATKGQMYSNFEECAPLLGNPHGPSPACNHVLVLGPTTVDVPPGNYDIVATVGPFSTLALAQDVVVTAGETEVVQLDVQMLDLQPAGTLSGDFHIHGSASFDSGMPDDDRVRAFLASRIQVIASTEHDSVFDYAESMERVGVGDRMHMMVGTESTGHILAPLLSQDITVFPKVIGHWNAWPIPYDAEGPYNGAPWDELVQPGGLFTRYAEAGWPEDDGVIQLNHPVGGLQFGRDFGWASALQLDTRKNLKKTGDGSGNSLFLETPRGADFANDAFHVQEVMNGTHNADYLGYRRFWHYLLDQGVVRGGTANSDSHSLRENVVGTPRTIITTDTTMDDFDADVFNASVRAGTMFGTNGPVIELSTDTGDGPSLAPVSDGASTIDIRISAAPWVPVDEVRIVVNSEVVQTITDLKTPTDPWDDSRLERLDVTLDLDDLLPSSGDAWLVVEAGRALIEQADLNCDGLPDTGDNNGDGKIDWKDVEGLSADPEADCYDDVGPIKDPDKPERNTPDWYFWAATPPGGYASAFTNPLLVDRDGDGFEGAR